MNEMHFSPASYILPSTIALVAFGVWALVMGRMTNLHCPWQYRAGLFVWMTAMLLAAWFDLYRTHTFASRGEAIVSVTLRSLLWAGCAVVGAASYRWLGMAYPEAMHRSPHESDSKFPVITLTRAREHYIDETGA